jgi:hypothetical protein
MTLALVQATMVFVALMIATWSGLLVSVAFLLPRAAARAEHVAATEPWWCLLRGVGLAILFAVGVIGLSIGNPVIKLFFFTLAVAVASIAIVGAVGLAQTIGKRGQPEGEAPTIGMLLRGSLVYSLALGFPVVGWFVFAPLSLIMAAGAGIMALFPEQGRAYYPPSIPPTGNEYDLSGRTGAIS